MVELWILPSSVIMPPRNHDLMKSLAKVAPEMDSAMGNIQERHQHFRDTALLVETLVLKGRFRKEHTALPLGFNEPRV